MLSIPQQYLLLRVLVLHWGQKYIEPHDFSYDLKNHLIPCPYSLSLLFWAGDRKKQQYSLALQRWLHALLCLLCDYQYQKQLQLPYHKACSHRYPSALIQLHFGDLFLCNIQCLELKNLHSCQLQQLQF